MPVLTKINTNSIAEDAITGDKFAGDTYLANTATQNITGTYSESRLYTSDAYTLSGNTTVNSNLTLSTVKSTGDVVLTAGGAYTITGTGVLSGGSILSNTPQRTSLTGMSGVIGSDVTLPKGSVVQVRFKELDATTSTTSTTFQPTGLEDTINFTSGNKILIQCGLDAYHHSGGSDTGGTYRFSTDNFYGSTNMIGKTYDTYMATATAHRFPLFMYFLYAPSGTSVQITVKYHRAHGGTVHIYDSFSWLSLTEIQT